jgi:hypothetical protein
MTCKEAMRRLEAPEQEAAGSRVDDGEVAATSDRERGDGGASPHRGASVDPTT